MVWDWVMGHGSCGVTGQLNDGSRGSQNVAHCELWYCD